MADVKTILRELSVAITVGLLKAGIAFEPAELYDAQDFLYAAQNYISGDLADAYKLETYQFFNGELRNIVDNGYNLGLAIFQNPYFRFRPEDQIKWLGNDTQKKDPIDISIGPYGFSLKEESFILKNMGLYALLNTLTNSRYPQGLHIFQTFAPREYDAWFNYTWRYLQAYLNEEEYWVYETDYYTSSLSFSANRERLILAYNDNISAVPASISTAAAFMDYTNARTREKAFAKWIKDVLAYDREYLRLKKLCSETAGRAICAKINRDFCPDNLYEFFRIYDREYFYAKTTPGQTSILRVPSRRDFHSLIVFKGCRYEVPQSQLNIISTFENVITKRQLEFRNECRFSHGQFNGTPEAKMYVRQNTNLSDLYEPLN